MGDMDSGNSGSIQSSSAGDDDHFEYSSSSRAATATADSFSAFLSPTTTSFPPPQLPLLYSSGTATAAASPMFDPAAVLSYFDRSPSLDMVWPGTLRPDPNPIPGPINHMNPIIASAPSTDPPQLSINNPPRPSDQAAPPPRNPKKRSRASRRAPTTVLTTDTTNFRQMVQEFTGIPAPPFSSSAFPRARLDLFGLSGLRGGGSGGGNSQESPPYLLRPFVQKFQAVQPPYGLSTSTANTSTNGYNPDRQHQQHNNPILSFQSILQPDTAVAGKMGSGKTTTPQVNNPTDDPTLKTGLLMEEYGLRHGSTSSPSLVSLQGISPPATSRAGDSAVGAQNGASDFPGSFLSGGFS